MLLSKGSQCFLIFLSCGQASIIKDKQKKGGDNIVLQVSEFREFSNLDRRVSIPSFCIAGSLDSPRRTYVEHENCSSYVFLFCGREG